MVTTSDEAHEEAGMKPFSQSCENNRDPILKILSPVFQDHRRVLEIGSGTGQHAVYFSRHLPHLQWFTSDLQDNHPGIFQWISEFPQPNLHPPCILDVTQTQWNVPDVDAVFTANTLHIMPWHAVEKLFEGLGRLLPVGGRFAAYGPFNFNGQYTSDSNKRFDTWLKAQNVERGIRDFEKVDALASSIGMVLEEKNSMPANNWLMIWCRKE